MKVYFCRDERWPDYSIVDAEAPKCMRDGELELDEEKLRHFNEIIAEYNRFQKTVDEAYEAKNRE